MTDRLSASELAEMINCKTNQRSVMVGWLESRRWKYDTDRTGLPIVMRAYRDRKLGTSDEKQQVKYADAPNLKAFA